MGLPKIRVLNVARVGQTHTKRSAVSSSNWQDAQTGLVASPILWKCLFMVHTNATNFTTNSFTSSQTRILAKKNRQQICPF
jgi:hypothetical protein